MTSFRCLSLSLVAGLSLFAVGCGKQAMVPGQGTVTYRGAPLNNGIVVFVPESKGPLAIGRIREDGVFALYTGDNPGVYPGKYRVTISSLAPGASSESFGRFEFPRSAIPDKYRDPFQSGIPPFEVLASRPNTFPVELTD